MRRIAVAGTSVALGLVMLTAGLSSGSALAANGCANVRTTPAENPQAAHDATICLVNRERAQRGLSALRSSDTLASAARGHSRDMVKRTYFAHTAPGNVTFADRIQRARYTPRGRWTIGENLAWGSAERSQPLQIVAAWMNSPLHRANILDGRFHAIGLGIARGVPVAASAAAGRVGATYTTDFGSS